MVVPADGRDTAPWTRVCHFCQTSLQEVGSDYTVRGPLKAVYRNPHSTTFSNFLQLIAIDRIRYAVHVQILREDPYSLKKICNLSSQSLCCGSGIRCGFFDSWNLARVMSFPDLGFQTHISESFVTIFVCQLAHNFFCTYREINYFQF